MQIVASIVSLKLVLPVVDKSQHTDLKKVVQSVLIVVALAITIIRCWIRLNIERRSLTIPDYLVIAGWFSTLGFFVGSVVALHIQLKHPLVEPDLLTNSIAYLKVYAITIATEDMTDQTTRRCSSYATSLTSVYTSQRCHLSRSTGG